MTTDAEQLGLDLDRAAELSQWQEFETWAHTPGGRHVMADLYRRAYGYWKRYERTGRRVSIRLIWELERDHIMEVRRRMKRRGVTLAPWKGYMLNDHFHSRASRHMIEHKPEWAGLFEQRPLKEKRRSTKIIAIKIPA
jgi:hypothetical protein